MYGREEKLKNVQCASASCVSEPSSRFLKVKHHNIYLPILLHVNITFITLLTINPQHYSQQHNTICIRRECIRGVILIPITAVPRDFYTIFIAHNTSSRSALHTTPHPQPSIFYHSFHKATTFRLWLHLREYKKAYSYAIQHNDDSVLL